MSLVELSNPNAKVGGLLRVDYHATNPVIKAALAKLGTLNSTWDRLRPTIEKELSAELKRPVVLLAGNYVKQKAGVVTYHGANPLGAKFIPGGRKGWDAKKGVFHVWVVVK